MALFSITADGQRLTRGDRDSGEDVCNVTVEPYTESEYYCRNCSASLDHYPGDPRPWQTIDKSGQLGECIDADPDTFDEETSTFGPHEPAFTPLSWVDTAEIDVDESSDMITMSLVIDGSPVTLSVSRVNNPAHEEYGKLVLLVPYSEMSTPLPIREIQRGSYYLM